jgi:glutamyl-tRNA reductase
MPVVCIGLSHQTAPVEVRERHAFPAARMGEALVALRDYEAVREAAMLQTCGRIEIYAELDDYEAGVTQLKSFLANFRHGSTGYDIESYLYTLLGRQAVEHLFRVATGLDSMLIGEAEILGQVKDAYIQAQHANSLGKSLHRLFRDALAAGKSARTQTRIGDESASVATAAVDAAEARLGTLHGKSVVVVGAGAMGRLAAKRLRQAGAEHLMVTNRSMSRARELIAETGFGEAIELPGLVEALAAADLIVTSTGASHFIVTPERVREAMALRPDRPMLIFDIAVPRDTDPRVVEIPNVALVDIDGLKSAVDVKLGVRREAIPEVEEIIEEFVARYQHWHESRVAVPVIATLTQRAESIRTLELERLFARCPGLTERERLLVTGMSMTIVSKLLHSVILKIRDKATVNAAAALSDARVLDELFELNLADHIANLIPQAVVIDGDE